jgi:hypothetical protein
MKNKAMSDEGGKRQETKSSDSGADGGDLPEPIGFRRLIQDGIGLDRLLLAYNCVFLPSFSFILWIIFLVIK